MPRDHAQVNLDIWNDPEFRALPQAPQHLYLTLWTHPDLTYCGSMDWRPARLSGMAAQLAKEDVTRAAECLQARHFLVIDEGTEEVLIRSWIRFDGLMKQPRMAISCINAYGAMGSSVLRAAVVHELRKLREHSPDLPSWSDDRVLRILEHPATSAKTYPTPEDPFGDGFTPGVTHSVTPPLPEVDPSVKGSVCTPSTPSPSPTPSSTTPTAGRSHVRATRIDPDFTTTDTMRAWAKDKGFDHLNLDAITEDFVDYWLPKAGKDATKTDWTRTWQRWVRKEATNTFRRPPAPSDAPRLPTIADVQRMEAEREERERGGPT